MSRVAGSVNPPEWSRLGGRRLAADASAPGAGLGLSIAAAARLHGGALLLEDGDPGLRAVLRIHASTTS